MLLDSVTTRRVAATSDLTDGLFSIPMIDVRSSNLARLGYDEDTRRLYVEFSSGATYRYERVPNDVFEALLQADEDGDSVGSMFNARVKKGGFGYARL